MLTQYIQSAMHRASYEILEDQTFYAEIPGLEGVYANAETLEQCRDQLREVLEGWIILGLRMGQEIPELDGINLNVNLQVA